MNKVRVLIAEDESIVAIDLRSRLESHGYAVVKHVLSGADAIKYAVELKPDIVLMDIHLKDDIDGIEAAKSIRQQLPIPVIFLTAYADNETLERAKFTDVFGYIIKPYQERELFVNIEIALFKYEMEEKLKSSQIRLDTTLKSIGDAVITTNSDGAIDFLNKSAERLLKVNPANAIGKTINSVIDISTNVNNQIVKEFEGVTKTFEVTDSRIFDDQQKVTGDVYILRDVSLRKEYENNLRKAKKEAEEASILKSDFLANMSHELRTPLNSILGLTELSLEAESDDERQEYLTIVKQAGESLLGLINSILDFSKIEAGKMKKEDIPFDLLQVMEETIERLYIQAHKKGIQMTLNFDNDCPLYLIGDSHKLFQILINLIGNSIKFTDSGYIHLEVSPVLKTEGQVSIRFTVEDTGKGIPNQKKEHIFDSFTQVDSSSTRIHGGTGLGLAIVKKLVELLNGSIEVESELGEGSRFCFELPFELDTNQERKPGFRTFNELKAHLFFQDEYAAKSLAKKMYHFALKDLTIEHNNNKIDFAARVLKDSRSLFIFDSQTLQDEKEHLNGLEAENKTNIFVLCEINEQSYWRNQGYANVLINPVKLGDIENQIISFMDYLGRDHFKLVKKKLIDPAPVSYSILLLEDDRNNRMIAEKILKQRGHAIQSCADGKKGLEKLAKEHFDLLLVDIQMPDMDGMEFTRFVRNGDKNDWDTEIPIIAVTAHAIGGYKERCEAVGMNGFITKPYTVKDFITVIEKIMDSYKVGESTGNKAHKNTNNKSSGGRNDIDLVTIKNLEKHIENKEVHEIEQLCLYIREKMQIDNELSENIFRLILAARRNDMNKIEQLWLTVMESFRSRR